jgi:hypothetical protein
MRQTKLWISAFIILVIALHAVPLLSASLRRKAWPFLEWGMYKGSRPPGEIKTVKRRITGVTVSGQKHEVTPFLLGSSIYALRDLYQLPMGRGDSSAARRLFTRLNSQRKDPFIELRLESETYTITDTGVVKRDNPPMTYQAAHQPSR